MEYYRETYRILNLKHEVYSLEIRNLIRQVIQYVKDRTRLFDNVSMKLIVWLNGTLINEKIKWEFMETISRMIKYV